MKPGEPRATGAIEPDPGPGPVPELPHAVAAARAMGEVEGASRLGRLGRALRRVVARAIRFHVRQQQLVNAELLRSLRAVEQLLGRQHERASTIESRLSALEQNLQQEAGRLDAGLKALAARAGKGEAAVQAVSHELGSLVRSLGDELGRVEQAWRRGLEGLRGELEGVRGEVAGLERELARERGRDLVARRELEEADRRTESRLDSLAEAFSGLERRLRERADALGREVERLATELARGVRELREAVGAVGRGTRAELDSTRSELSRLIGHIEQFERDCTRDLETLRERFDQVSGAHGRHLDELGGRLLDLHKELRRVRSELSVWEERVPAVAEESAAQGLRLDELGQRMVEALNELRALENELGHLRTNHGGRLETLASELERISQGLGQAQQDLLALGDQMPTVAAEMRERLAAVQRSLRPEALLDPFDFSRRFRGDPTEIRKRMERYARLFGGGRRVLDVGCGRGEFLEVCRELGINAIGVDSDPDMVSHCRLKGLEVGESDAIAYLESLDDRSLDGIFSAQVIEHFTPAEIIDFVRLAAAKLKRGGLFVAETINPTSFSALRWYFLDLTHRQPVPSETLAYLLEKVGFVVRDVLWLSPVRPEVQLEPVAVADAEADPRWIEVVNRFNANVEKLNDLLYGRQDYAIIAER